MYVDNTKELTVVEWFTGYGGNELGLRGVLPNMRPIAFCEREAFVVANLVSKMEAGLLDPVPIWTDVTTFPVESFVNRVGLFIASYPCQGFSHAGKRLGVEDERHLWPYCRRFIQGARPGWVWLENVEGHVTLGLSTVLADLEEDGYEAAWGIFSASEVGAPHQRKRVFILAYDHSNGHIGRPLQDGVQRREISESAQPQQLGQPMVRGAIAGRGECESVGDTAQHLFNGPRKLPGGGIKFANASVWPSRPGQAQYGWEPPRVVSGGSAGNGNSKGQRNTEGKSVCGEERKSTGHTMQSVVSGNDGEIKPPLDRNPYGTPPGLDLSRHTGLGDSELAEIYSWMEKGTNRTDELRMCGNGVVPQTAERAFTVLAEELFGSEN